MMKEIESLLDDIQERRDTVRNSLGAFNEMVAQMDKLKEMAQSRPSLAQELGRFQSRLDQLTTMRGVVRLLNQSRKMTR